MTANPWIFSPRETINPGRLNMIVEVQISDPAQREIKRLRKESAKYRSQRNAARTELAELKASIGVSDV